MRTKQSLNQCSQSTKETNDNSYCIVCSLNNNCSDTPKENVDLGQIFSVFCKYFKLNSSQFTNLHQQNSQVLSLFCSKCMNLLEKLWDQDVQLNILQHDISHTVAVLACNILQQQSGNQSLQKNEIPSSQIVDRNKQNQTEKSKMVQIIRQQFSPRVVMQDLKKDKNHPIQIQSQLNCCTETKEEATGNAVIKDEEFDDWNDYAEQDIFTDEKELKVQSVCQVPLKPSISPRKIQSVPRIVRERSQEEQKIDLKLIKNDEVTFVEILSPPSEVFVDNLNSMNETSLLNSPTSNYMDQNQVEIIVEGEALLFDTLSDSTYKCCTCDIITASRDDMIMHLSTGHQQNQSHSSSSSFTESSTIFLDGKEWNVTQLEDGKFKCPVENCPLIRRSILLIKAHMMRGHKKLKQLEKRQTSKLVEKSQEVVIINYKGNNLEIERSENNNKFKCPIDNCKSMRKTKISIIDHVKRVHQILEEENETKRKRKEKSVSEGLNDEEFTKITFEGKEWTIEQLDTGKYKCPFENCNGTRCSRFLVKTHMLRAHKKKPEKKKRKKKPKNVNNQSQKTILTNIDEEEITTINFQGTDFTIEQVENGRFVCPIGNCNTTRATKSNLKFHMERIHEKRRLKLKRKPVDIVIIPPANSDEEKKLMINLKGIDWMIEKLANGKFKCPIENCTKGIRSTIELVKNHMKHVHSGKPRAQKLIRKTHWIRVEDPSISGMYQCRDCDEIFDSLKSFFLHHNSVHNTSSMRKYRLPKGTIIEGPNPGTFIYGDKWLMETIPPEENNSNTLRCGTCEEETKTRKLMVAHIVDVHLNSMSQGSKLVCQVCNFTLKRQQGPRSFIAHMRRHWTEIPEIIPVGYSRFMYQGKWFFGHNENEYRCFACQSATSNQEEILEHLESQHNDYVICEYCGEKFRNRAGLQAHILNFGDHSDLENLGDGKFSFNIGQKQWPFEKMEENFEGLNQAVRYKCGTCSSKMWTLNVVRSHIKSVHIDPKSFMCDGCGRTFTTATGLIEHRNVFHSDPEYLPFICPSCGLRFKTKKRLQAHEETHKDWRCPNCNKQFKYSKGVRRHLQNHCSGVEGNNCPSCHVYFKRKDTLQTHIDNGECTGNSSNRTYNKTSARKRHHHKVPEQEQNDSPAPKPKKKRTETNSSSKNRDETTSSVEEDDGEENEEVATELWTFGIDQNQIE